MKARITHADFNTLLAHATEQFINFYVIYNHARLNKPHEINSLKEINNEIISMLHDAEINDEHIVKLKITSEFWDSVQCNFSYDRVLSLALLSEEEKTIYKNLVLFIKDLKSNPEFITTINYLNSDFFHLNWLRIADIINAVTPQDFLKNIRDAKKYQLSKRRVGSHDDNQPIRTSLEANTAQPTPLSHALSFYPEKLKPGIFYVYPQIDDNSPISSLAISCHFNAKKEDIHEAFDEYEYQFEKFKNYYHINSNDFIEAPEIEKLRPLLKRNLNKNKHVKRKGNIEEHILALICWEKIHLDGSGTNEAISSVLPKGYSKNKFASLKNRLALISTAIDEWNQYYNEMNYL